jgi:carbamoyltransferase
MFKNDEELIETTAELIFKNNIVGWFQGRMEWGPRALGSRSILANPCNPKMKDILNNKVKHREGFRPYAPVLCEEDIGKYFKCDKSLPVPTNFMLIVYPIKEKWHDKIPSVTHIDGTGRLQALNKKQNPLLYNLIKKFGDFSGYPILINTSYNIRGEPIVCNTYDAYRCMMGTGIDYLVIDKFLIAKRDN